MLQTQEKLPRKEQQVQKKGVAFQLNNGEKGNRKLSQVDNRKLAMEYVHSEEEILSGTAEFLENM